MKSGTVNREQEIAINKLMWDAWLRDGKTVTAEDVIRRRQEMEKTAMEAGLKTVQYVIELADTPPIDRPISVTIVDLTGRIVASLSMDGAMPISSELSCKKARTSVLSKKDTLSWEGLNPADFVHPDITCFGGGIPILDFRGIQVGGIGVSGRQSHKATSDCDGPMQDHELALAGSRFIQNLWPEKYY